MLRILDIFVRIRIRIQILWSIPLTNGSGCGSGSPKNIRIRIRNNGTFTSFFKDQNSCKSHKQQKSRFFLLFLLYDGRIRNREAQKSYGSGSGSETLSKKKALVVIFSLICSVWVSVNDCTMYRFKCVNWFCLYSFFNVQTVRYRYTVVCRYQYMYSAFSLWLCEVC